jgi:hypothetical protein
MLRYHHFLFSRLLQYYYIYCRHLLLTVLFKLLIKPIQYTTIIPNIFKCIMTVRLDHGKAESLRDISPVVFLTPSHENIRYYFLLLLLFITHCTHHVTRFPFLFHFTVRLILLFHST